MTSERQREAVNQKFERILELLRSHLLMAQVHLDIYSELRSTPARLRLFATYSGFFAWTSDAHIDRFFNKTAIAVDRDRKAPSLYKLLNMIQSHPNLAPSISVDDVRRNLEEVSAIQEQITDVRNQRSAHWDMLHEPPLPSLDDCRALLRRVQGFHQDIYNAHNPRETGIDIFSYVPVGHNHTNYILTQLLERHPYMQEPQT